jgi:acyl-coenzyme A synthetase/AMP-(fatty) acid ligase
LIEAAVIPKEGAEVTHNLLAKHVGSKLPPYAVPTKINVMQDFPRTSTGKINRRELQSLAIETVSD